MHVDDRLKPKRYHTLERRNRQNLVLNRPFRQDDYYAFSFEVFVNKLLLDDIKKCFSELVRGKDAIFNFTKK